MKAVINVLNEKDSQGNTALHHATENLQNGSSLKVMRILLRTGAQTNELNNGGMTPLLLAIYFSRTRSSEETVQILIYEGDDINNTGFRKWNPLMVAARYATEESTVGTVKTLLDAGAKPFLKNECGLIGSGKLQAPRFLSFWQDF